MFRNVSVFAALIFILATGFSQNIETQKNIDKITYELYLNKDWKELAKIGEQAIKSGSDYYYMRMRVGISWYERKDYIRAIPHFKKALEFNSTDDIAKEYLYYSNLFAGRELIANNIASEFSFRLKEKLKYEYKPGIRSFTLEAGYDFTGDSKFPEEYAISIDPLIDGKQVISNGFQYYHAGIQHDAGKWGRMFHSVSYLNRSGLFYQQDGGTSYTDTKNRIAQLQYFMGMNVYLGSGFYIYPSIHYINIRSPYLVTVQGRWGSQYNILQYDYEHQFVGFLGIGKTIGKIKPELSAAYMYLNKSPYLQGGFFLSYYPLGNLNLYSTSKAYYHFPALDFNEGRFIFFQELGFKAFSNLWIELWISEGLIENFAGNSGFLVYNDLSVITRQYGANLIIPIIKQGMELSLRFRHSAQESSFVPVQLEEGINLNTIKVNHNTITGGVKWKF